MVNDEIKQLQERARKAQEELLAAEGELSRRQSSCQHSWDQAVSDPEEISIPSFSHYEACGSGPNPICKLSKGTKPRWSRVCPKCGKVEYTYEVKPVKYEPVF